MRAEFEGTVTQIQSLLTETVKSYVLQKGGTCHIGTDWLQGEVYDEYETYTFNDVYVEDSTLIVDYTYTFRGEEQNFSEPFVDLDIDQQYAILKNL